MIHVIEDFLTKSQQDNLEKVLLDRHIEWRYYPGTCKKDLQSRDIMRFREDTQTKDHAQFVHILKDSQENTSEFYPLIENFLNIVNSKAGKEFNHIHRAKINLQLSSLTHANNTHNMAHVDIIVPKDMIGKCMSLLYYVNDSDGDTVFFNQYHGDKTDLTINTTKAPKKGTAVLFDSNMYHASSVPVKSKHRVVINLVLTEDSFTIS